MKDFFLVKAVVWILLCYSPFQVGYAAHEMNKNVFVVIDKYKKMSPKELIMKGDTFFFNNANDSAMICYSLIYNDLNLKNDLSSQQILCQAMNRIASIWFNYCDYETSLDFLLRALTICEKIGYHEYVGRIYNNVGSIYYRFNDFKSARKYYDLAYKNVNDSYLTCAVLNNIGLLEQATGKTDTALLFFKKSYALVKKNMKDSVYNETLNNIGSIYQAQGDYDSAFAYYQLALNSARQFKSHKNEAVVLSSIAQIHFKRKDYDAAIHYLEESNAIALKNTIFALVQKNYLLFAEIETIRENTTAAFNYYKQYSLIKDSIFDASKYAAINELQMKYDMAKIDKHIKELNVEQEIKDRTIRIQTKLQVFMGLSLLTVIVFLILFYIKNKTLNRAYNVLADKNLEIVEAEEMLQEKKIEVGDEEQKRTNNVHSIHRSTSSIKYKGSSLKDDIRDKLLVSILEVMENEDVFCDGDFTVDKLSKMVESNPNYVSQIINDSFKMNFRTFINGYRIKKARKILSDPSYQKYSIESIGSMVGFKSRRVFDISFKEITGITPAFYIKSIKRE